MSDDDSEDSTDREVDWEMLKAILSPDALFAMQQHLETKKGFVEPEKVPAGRINIIDASDKYQGKSVFNEVFSKQKYWEERFEEEDTYDWLVKYSNIRNILAPVMKCTDRILVVGCGNSTFSADLYDDGFHNVTNIDYSNVVIEKMRAIHSEIRPEMQWLYMDMTAMTFDAESFDVVIDKAAMDALMVDEGDVWFPARTMIESSHKMCDCVRHVLKSDDGLFVQISFAQPHFRSKYLMGIHAEDEGLIPERKKQDRQNGLDSTRGPYDTYSGVSQAYRWNLSSQSISLEEGCLNSYLYLMHTV
jgi:SAM-dependent methyltransferase